MKSFIVSMALVLFWLVASSGFTSLSAQGDVNAALKQFENGSQEYTYYHYIKTNGVMYGWGVVAVLCLILNRANIAKLFKSHGPMATLMLLCLSMTGCWKPFEPRQLETIGTQEEGFLIPYVGDSKEQVSTASEEYLKQNLVSTKQVAIPQQWVSLGYETMRWNGEWRPAAVLIKVDKSPVTREWTASKNSGTSAKDEAIWVMTADQVEFSTGWTCTARIESKEDAIKFLHNYPNGSLEAVMDGEIRAKLQSEFALAVTDLPMNEMRKAATPHILKVIETIKKFFQPRGISITNLGITGGFVYKDKSIQDTMVKVFNAEQEKLVSAAETAAQTEKNKKIELEADAKAANILKLKKAEAEGIRAVAEAKAYEIEKAKEDPATYVLLKNIEIQKERVEKWNGIFPAYYIGSSSVEMLLTPPTGLDAIPKKPTPPAATAKKE